MLLLASDVFLSSSYHLLLLLLLLLLCNLLGQPTVCSAVLLLTVVWLITQDCNMKKISTYHVGTHGETIQNISQKPSHH